MASETLTDALRETLRLFGESGEPRTTTEVAAALDLGRRSTYERLERLVECGRLETKKVGASARVWWQPLSGGAESAPTGAHRERHALVGQILETAPADIIVLDSAGVVTEANDRFRERIGAETVAGELSVGDLDLYDETGEPIPSSERPYVTVFETGESVTDWACQVDLPGGRRWASLNVAPITGDDGEVERAVVAAQDVTQLKERVRRLERQRDGLQAELGEVFERVDDAFFALDGDWRFVHVNEQAAGLLGRPIDELAGHTIWEALPETVDSTFQAEYERAMATQESVSFEEHYDPLDTWFEVTAYPSESGLSVYFRDVTDRKARQRELERYETIVEAVQDGIYVVDEDGYFTQVNESYAEMVGHAREDLIGAPASAVVGEEIRQDAKRLEEELIAGERTTASLEAELETPDGEPWIGEATFALMETDEGYERIGVTRDVTERKEHERELETRVRQQEVVTDLGTYALEERDLDALMADATALVAETLDADYCEVLDRDAEELLLRQGVGWREELVGEATASAVEDDSQAAHTLATEEPVVVEDLDAEDRFSGPDLLTGHGVRSGISTIIGPPDDPWGILGAHDTRRREFAEEDVNFVQSIATILATAIERHGYENRLLRKREQLAALDNLNQVVHDITEAVIEQSTREEIEQTVCERLADTDSYQFAWIGDGDAASRTVTLRAEAGVEGYLDGITIPVDPDTQDRGPTAQALLTGEVTTTQDVDRSSRHDPWRDHIEQYDWKSSAAIPVVHGETVYGVLNVYAERTHAFEGRECEVVTQLGAVVGHAIAAAERKQALLSDDLVELEFHVQGAFEALPGESSGTITLDQTVAVADGEFLVYGTATPDATDTVTALVETLPEWEAVTFHSEGDPAKFELRLSDPPVLSVVASHGGYVERAVVEDGDYRMRIHLAPTVDVRRVAETVEAAYPRAEMVRRRQITRSRDDPRHVRRRVVADLSDRQRVTLETAHHAGFFEWPRDASGEEVAESLGVTPPTFHQHLRKAEKKIFEALLSAPDSGPVG